MLRHFVPLQKHSLQEIRVFLCHICHRICKMLTDNIILLQIGDFCILHICHTYTGFFPPCYISHCSCYICVKRVADVADGF